MGANEMKNALRGGSILSLGLSFVTILTVVGFLALPCMRMRTANSWNCSGLFGRCGGLTLQ